MDTEAEIRRTARLLEIEIRLANTSKRAIEKKLGWAAGYLTKVIQGGLELRVRHILAVAGTAGFDPGEFFAKAFPPAPAPGRRQEESPALEKHLEQAIDRILARHLKPLEAEIEALREAVKGRSSARR